MKRQAVTFLLCLAEFGMKRHKQSPSNSNAWSFPPATKKSSESLQIDLQCNVPGFWIWKPAHDAKGFPPKPALLKVTVERKDIQNGQGFCQIDLQKKLFATTEKANCVVIITVIFIRPKLGSYYKASHGAPAWQGSSLSPSIARSASCRDNFVLFFAFIQNHCDFEK